MAYCPVPGWIKGAEVPLAAFPLFFYADLGVGDNLYKGILLTYDNGERLLNVWLDREKCTYCTGKTLNYNSGGGGMRQKAGRDNK